MSHKVTQDTGNCKRCGRELTDEISIDRGYGPRCYQKHLREKELWKEQRDEAHDRKKV